MLAIRTILHATDLSERSDYAFRLACSLARDYGARLVVLHVLERPVLIYTGVMTAPPPPPPSAEERQAVREQLLRIKPSDSAIGIEHVLQEGDPATVIAQFAPGKPVRPHRDGESRADGTGPAPAGQRSRAGSPQSLLSGAHGESSLYFLRTDKHSPSCGG